MSILKASNWKNLAHWAFFENIRLSQDGEYLFVYNRIISLKTVGQSPLFANWSRFPFASIDPNWSKIAVIYQDTDKKYYIGVCDASFSNLQ